MTVNEKEPLSDKDYEDVLSSAYSLGGEYLKTILVLRWTGMHVSILAEPIKYDLHVQKENDGLYFVWKRTKKRGRDAYIDLKVSRHIIGIFDVEQWIMELRKRRESKRPRRISRQYFFSLVKKVGVSSGHPELSPMTFRHTLGVWMLNNGYPEKFVQQKLNVSSRVLKTYLKYTRQTEMPMYRRLGW